MIMDAAIFEKSILIYEYMITANPTKSHDLSQCTRMLIDIMWFSKRHEPLIRR